MDDAVLWTVRGEPVGRAVAARSLADGPLRAASREVTVAPVGAGDVVQIEAAAAPAAGDVVLCDVDGACRLMRLLGGDGAAWMLREEPGGAPRRLPLHAIVGVVTRVEQGDVVLDLRRGRWRLVGGLLARWPSAAPLALFLALVERLRRPLFPPLWLGPEEALLAGVRDAYEREAGEFAEEDALREEEAAAAQRHLRPGMRALDVGCGGGREALALARLGLDVTAIDLAPRMVALARARAAAAGLRLTFEVNDVATVAGGPFDVVYLSPGVYAHLPGYQRRLEALRHLGARLAPGGVLWLSVVLEDAPRRLSRARLVDALRRLGRRCGMRRLSEPGDGLSRGHALAPPPACFRYIHRFRDAGEVERELGAAGFTLIERVGDRLWVARPREGPPASSR